MSVLHICDVPHCVNPDHLFLGTQLDNMRDCKHKGRMKFPKARHGELTHNAKLTEDAIIEIRKGEKLQREYAVQFGVARVTISNVQTGKRWRHVA